MKNLILLLGLYSAFLDQSQSPDSLQLIYSLDNSREFLYVKSPIEGRIFVSQLAENSDIILLKEDQTIFYEFSRPINQSFFLTDINIVENGEIYISYVQCNICDDDFSNNVLDVTNDFLTDYQKIWRVGKSHLTIASDTAYNLDRKIAIHIPDNRIVIPYQFLSTSNQLKIHSTAYQFMMDESLSITSMWKNDKYKILNFGKNADGNNLVTVRLLNTNRIQVFKDDGELLSDKHKDNIPSDVAFYKTYPSDKYSAVSILNHKIYHSITHELLATFNDNVTAVKSHNDEHYFLVENEDKDSILVMDSNLDSISCFVKPFDPDLKKVKTSLHFFHGDSAFEFALHGRQETIIMNENGDILHRLAYSESFLLDQQYIMEEEENIMILSRKHLPACNYANFVYKLPSAAAYEEPSNQKEAVIYNMDGPFLAHNPFHEMTEIKNIAVPFDLNIYTSDGRLIHTAEINNHEDAKFSELNSMPAGVYFFQLFENGKQSVLKGIKK